VIHLFGVGRTADRTHPALLAHECVELVDADAVTLLEVVVA
jgi:hypothetical protein